LKLLLEHHADPNAANARSWTPLMEAARRGLVDVTDLLLAQGAKVDARQNAGWTAFMTAAFADHLEVAQRLLSKGANINAQTLPDSLSRTSLMQAALRGRPDVVKFLIDKGADPNITDSNGQTALSLAEQRNNQQVIAILRSAGAK
jgi:ankyrin repeat protein